jgi:APA family basic amino acid/polyamine antiporter
LFPPWPTAGSFPGREGQPLSNSASIAYCFPAVTGLILFDCIISMPIQETPFQQGMAMPNLFLRKPVDEKIEHGLKRVLGPLALTMLGIGAIIGTGIFVLTGTAAAGNETHLGAGPAIVISFVITAVACGLAALCYAEFASMVPASGSAYTYAYASFGELVAWIIGWDLILEYAVGNIAVAIGWSGYFSNFLQFFGIHLPAWLLMDPMSANAWFGGGAGITADQAQMASEAFATAPWIGFPIIMNLPAVIIVMLVTALLVYGIRESANVNSGLVFLKLALIGLFIVVGLQHVDFATHWAVFAPHGFAGISTGAALIFFAYIGFDAVSTTAEEAKNPQRDLPIGMIASLMVCTILYIVVSAILTGMVPLETLNNAHPVAAALDAVGEKNVATVISLGAVLSITSVLVVMQLAQTRIFYVMSRDGLLPSGLSRLSSRFGTPIVCTVLTGIIVAIPSGLIDIGAAAELTNIGTLFAFVLVAGGIMILRVKAPEAVRGFRIPLVWFAAPGCIGICAYLMVSLPVATWIRFVGWMAVGLVVYFSWSVHHSVLQKQARAGGR